MLRLIQKRLGFKKASRRHEVAALLNPAYWSRRLPEWPTRSARAASVGHSARMLSGHDKPVLEWTDNNRCQVNGVRFHVSHDTDAYSKGAIDLDGRLPIIKDRSMIEKTLSLDLPSSQPNIVEIGIWRGGSVALYDQVLRPAKLVALEWVAEVADLETYLDAHGRRGVVKPYYGINQDNVPRVEAIISSEFSNRDISLVVDDASHLYAETKATFNCIFPYVAAGGYYVIEDWGWAHWPGEYWNRDKFKDKPSLTNLLVELCMLAATRSDIVSSVEADSAMLFVKKGAAKLPATGWRVEDDYNARGLPFAPIL